MQAVVRCDNAPHGRYMRVKGGRSGEMAQPTDTQVLRRVRCGEQGAFTILFDRYYARILEYAVCVVQDEEAARAAVSRTFVKAFRDARRGRQGACGYPAHLYRVCRRHVHRDYPLLFSRG